VTTPTPPLPPPILISKRFRIYDKAIRDIWESLSLPHLLFAYSSSFGLDRKCGPVFASKSRCTVRQASAITQNRPLSIT
jgi:hypothetical protein